MKSEFRVHAPHQPNVYDNPAGLRLLDMLDMGEHATLVLPGLPKDTAEMVPPQWFETDTYSSNRLHVTIGKRGAMRYIVDPRTQRPITPGFHGIEELTNRALGFSVSHQSFELTGIQNPDNARGETAPAPRRGQLRRYPAFLFQPLLELRRVGQDTVVDPAQKSMFGFEAEDVDPQLRAGSELFEDTLKRTMGYALKDRQVLEAVRDPEAIVSLPKVQSTSLAAQLHFSSLDNGTNVMHLEGLDKYGDGGKGGFYLVQTPEGAVVIVDAALNTAIDYTDPAYSDYIHGSKDLLGEYFKAVAAQESARILSGESFFAIRQKLGSMSLRRASHTVRKAIAPK